MAINESAGIHLIKKAIELDTEKKYEEAFLHYKEGIHILLESLKSKIRLNLNNYFIYK